MASSPRLALASSRSPAMWLLNLDTAQSVPVQTLMDNGSAFSGGLGRRGWVAAKVEYQVGAYPDGKALTSPVLLPEAWETLPAATDDLVLLRLYFGRSSLAGEPMQVAVAGPNGVVHRSAMLPWDVGTQVVGEIATGVVTWSGIYEWEGNIRQLPVEVTGDPYIDPRPFGVLDGRMILFEGVDYIESVDTQDGSRGRIEIPPQPRIGPYAARFGPLRWFNSAGTRLAMVNANGWSGTADYVVAGPSGEVRWLPGLPWAASLWLGDKLVQWSWKDGRAVEYDPITDRFSRADVAPMKLHPDPVVPLVEVTGRFEWAS